MEKNLEVSLKEMLEGFSGEICGGILKEIPALTPEEITRIFSEYYSDINL